MTILIVTICVLCFFNFVAAHVCCKERRSNKILGEALDDASEELNCYRRSLMQLPKVRILLDNEGRPMAASVGEVAIASRKGIPDTIIEYDCVSGKNDVLTFPTHDALEVDDTVKLL